MHLLLPQGEAERMNRFKVCKLCITFIVIFAFVITIVCTVSVVCKKYEMNNKHTNSIDESSNGYSIRFVTYQDIESIIGINYSKDATNILNVSTKFENASSDEYASFTQVKIMYTISSNLIDERSYYSLKFDSITDEKTSNYEICQNIKHLKETYEIEEDEIQYINTQYGTCRYDINDGINEVDYYFYIFIIKTCEEYYNIYISGKYPYPIEFDEQS